MLRQQVEAGAYDPPVSEVAEAVMRGAVMRRAELQRAARMIESAFRSGGAAVPSRRRPLSTLQACVVIAALSFSVSCLATLAWACWRMGR